jgi:hypothetical protein
MWRGLLLPLPPAAAVPSLDSMVRDAKLETDGSNRCTSP